MSKLVTLDPCREVFVVVSDTYFGFVAAVNVMCKKHQLTLVALTDSTGRAENRMKNNKEVIFFKCKSKSELDNCLRLHKDLEVIFGVDALNVRDYLEIRRSLDVPKEQNEIQ